MIVCVASSVLSVGKHLGIDKELDFKDLWLKIYKPDFISYG